jgi:hypothetical protein
MIPESQLTKASSLDADTDLSSGFLAKFLVPVNDQQTLSSTNLSRNTDTDTNPNAINSNLVNALIPPPTEPRRLRDTIPFKCPLCSLIYRTQTHLNENMRKEHSVLI